MLIKTKTVNVQIEEAYRILSSAGYEYRTKGGFRKKDGTILITLEEVTKTFIEGGVV